MREYPEVDQNNQTRFYADAKHFGITYHLPRFLLPLWRWIFCWRGWHLFDEEWTGDEHDLCCDACELIVHIAKIETSYMDRAVFLLHGRRAT